MALYYHIGLRGVVSFCQFKGGGIVIVGFVMFCEGLVGLDKGSFCVVSLLLCVGCFFANCFMGRGCELQMG